MLTQLTIQNFALIERLTLEFDPKLNILTGETGAGKSIVIGALRFVLGERLDGIYVRDVAQTCIVEASFELTTPTLRINPLFSDYISEDNTLVIQRIQSPDGKSKAKVNGFAITIGQLKAIGDHLVDLHGPHDHQMLLLEDQHILLLDQMVSYGNLTADYKDGLTRYREIQRKLAHLRELAQTNQRDRELLAHEIKELKAVPLDEEHYQKLQQDLTKVNNAQKLNEHIQRLLEIFDNPEAGVDYQLRQAFSPLRSLNQIDPLTQDMTDELSLMQEHGQGLKNKLENYLSSMDYDDRQARQMQEEHDLYYEILRKFGPTLADAKKYYEEAAFKYDALANFEASETQLLSEIEANRKTLSALAQKITKKRQTASVELKTTVEKELKELGIPNARFEVRIEKEDFNDHGQDKVTFDLSPNAGEALKPLAQIVSSGEAARVMLALKKALIKVDPIPVLIFDEIDAQIGGRLGTITGKKLKELSRERQVLLITHLPQIASFADRHFKVAKSVKAGRTLTQVNELDKESRVKEIAQMMSGEKESKISLSHAQDMLANAK